MAGIGEEQRSRGEAAIRQSCREGDLEHAAEHAFRLYGDEVMGWLVRRFHSRQTAAEMYSNFSLYLWRYLPGFHWDSTLRTWMYAIARKVCYVEVPREQEPLSRIPENLSCLVTRGQARISTYKLPEVEDAYHVLCRSVLTEEEQDLLTWRIYAALRWVEIAKIVADDSNLGDDELRRRAAMLRKQFERIKTKLREAAEEQGLARLSP